VWAATLLPTGRLVTVSATLTYPATASGATAAIQGLPYACGTTAGAGIVAYQNSGVTFSLQVQESASRVVLYTTAGVGVTNAQMTGKILEFTATYFSPT
jgi:hypothetical protein